MTDLYAVLGIDPAEATMAALRRAWKRRVKESHPDTGGSREEFALVQTARMVLSDHVKRERYDRTGKYDAEPEPDNETAAINELLAQCLVTVVVSDLPDSALTRLDMIEKFRESLALPRKMANDALAANARVRKRFELLRGRFKDAGPDSTNAKVLNGAVQYEIAQIAAMDEKATKALERCDKAEEILASMLYEQEPDEPANLRTASYSTMTSY